VVERILAATGFLDGQRRARWLWDGPVKGGIGRSCGCAAVVSTERGRATHAVRADQLV